MRILVISYFYPPDRAVGGQRARKVVEALEGAGHEVSVIAAGVDTAGDHTTTRVRPLPSLRDLHRKVRSSAGKGTAHGETAQKPDRGVPGEVAGSRKVSRWKRWVFSLIWLPDDRQGFILPAVARALRSPHRPDVVYTTAPPFSVHLVGLLFQAITGARWIAEFRDPWTSNPWKPSFVRSALSDRIEGGLERLCLARADLVVAVSDGIATDVAERRLGTKLVTARNGIERLDRGPIMDAHEGKPEPYRLIYVGSFYHTRDPFPFLEALADLNRQGCTPAGNLRVDFIGTAPTFEGRSIARCVAQLGIAETVHLEGWMDREACLDAVRAADALLLFALQQPDQVPNKVYEYLGARRPILAIADLHGETARMLRRVGGHVVVGENSKTAIRDALDRLFARSRQGPVGDLAILEEWTTGNQMQLLMDGVGGLDVG